MGLPRRDHRPAGRWEGNIPSQPFPSARSTHSTAGWPATAIFRSASPSNARRERRLYRSSACRLVPRKPVTLFEGDLGLLQRAPPWRSKVAHSLKARARWRVSRLPELVLDVLRGIEDKRRVRPPQNARRRAERGRRSTAPEAPPTFAKDSQAPWGSDRHVVKHPGLRAASPHHYLPNMGDV